MLVLPASEVHLWTIQLSSVPVDGPPFRRWLSTGEIERAERFRFDRHRQEYVNGRGTLRLILARYLGEKPEEIELAYGARGKPRLAGSSTLRFNLSHSGGMGILAITQDCELGADIEAIRPFDDLANIANRFFCPEEYEDLMASPEDQQTQAFFHCWTRKEAYIKAIGEGLAAPLDQFRVTFTLDETPRFVHINHDSVEAEAWTVHNLTLGPSFAAALVYRHAPKELRLMSDALWP